jgi:DNA replication protein DnaC
MTALHFAKSDASLCISTHRTSFGKTMNNLITPDWLSSLDRRIAEMPDDTERIQVAECQRPLSRIDRIAPIVYTGMDGFPTRYDEELQHDEWFAMFERARNVIERGGNVLLCGTRGGGKTRMACELAQRAVLPRGKSKPKRIFKTAMRIFLEIRATYRRDSAITELEVMDNLATCRLLVIDEVQERAESEFEAQKLTAIIDDRYRHKLPTILIANLTPQAFQATLGPSICDRCNEDGGLLEFTWPSFRNADVEARRP